jgi:hypothetical protein
MSNGVGFDRELRKLDSVTPPETRFNLGLGWSVSVLVNTLKPHSRWIHNVCRGPGLLTLAENVKAWTLVHKAFCYNVILNRSDGLEGKELLLLWYLGTCTATRMFGT